MRHDPEKSKLSCNILPPPLYEHLALLNSPVTDSKAHLSRYCRQMLLPDFGAEGQQRLANARVLIVGCGALGCQTAELLSRAGVGFIRIVDRDLVEESNLQRQVLFDERDAREHSPKVQAARDRLSQINSQIHIDPIAIELDHRNATQLATTDDGRPVDLLLDGTDNFLTRYLLNDLAIALNIPMVYAGVVATRAMSMTIIPSQSACLRCIFNDPPLSGSSETCDAVGVLGPAVAIIAGYQASESLKILLGQTSLVSRSLLSFDLWESHRSRIELTRRDDCPACSMGQLEYLDGKHAQHTTRLCGQNAVQIQPAHDSVFPFDQLAHRLSLTGQFKFSEFCIQGSIPASQHQSDTPGNLEIVVFKDGRAIVRGTDQLEIASRVYARFVGL